MLYACEYYTLTRGKIKPGPIKEDQAIQKTMECTKICDIMRPAGVEMPTASPRERTNGGGHGVCSKE